MTRVTLSPPVISLVRDIDINPNISILSGANGHQAAAPACVGQQKLGVSPLDQ